MRLVSCLLILILGLPAAAHAQTIRVQSGDHTGFTRLVLPIGAEREWDLEQSPDGQWTLTLTPSVDGFDTSSAFNLIQRTRLSGLDASQSLALELACACDVTSFRHDARYLVIDIADPDPNAPEQVLPDPAEAERTAAANALPNLANLLGSPEGLPNVAAPEATAPTPDPVESPAAEAPNPRLAEAAQIMAEQLARAAASGLLDIAPNQAMNIGDPTDDALESPETEAEQAVAEVDPAPPPTRLEAPTEVEDTTLPIRAETAFDASVQPDLPISAPMIEASCANVPFIVADWAEGDGLHQNLGALRRDLYDERDVLTPSGALALAQHYLYYGFGAEAAYWLDQIADAPSDLQHVAALLDGAETAPYLPVETPDECSQGELLWRYLAGTVDVPLTTEDTAAVQRAFGELPPGLRDLLGPRLAVQLVDDGYAGTARNVRDVLHRGGRMETVALRMLDLDMGISLEAAPADLQQALAEALRDDGGDPVSVLTHALAFDRSVGTLPAPARLTTADALMRENGQGPETDDLWRETLLGYAALGQIDEAINRLGDLSRSDTARAEALTDLISERVSVGDTAALVVLAHTFGRDWRPEGSTAGRIQVRAIAALREDGLFEAAQILRDVRRPLILPAPDAPEAEPQDDVVIAWQEGNWPRLAETDAGTHATIAARLTQLSPADTGIPIITDLPDLQSLNATLTDSRALRSEIADLLAQPSLP